MAKTTTTPKSDNSDMKTQGIIFFVLAVLLLCGLFFGWRTIGILAAIGMAAYFIVLFVKILYSDK